MQYELMSTLMKQSLQ